MLAFAFAQRFPKENQQCRDDAGPPFTDDEDTFPGSFYWSSSNAKTVLNPDGSCPGPLAGACQTRANPLQAALEGPIECASGGWFCRIFPDENHGANGNLYSDVNFANCDVESPNLEATMHDRSGHCHGSSDLSTFYWWVRDHWFRGYAGRMKCCCGAPDANNGWEPRGVANRCDYRAKVTVNPSQCRDANEDHLGGQPGSGMLYGFEGGCPSNGELLDKDQIYEPADEMCWEVLKFGEVDAPGNDEILPSSTGPCQGAGKGTRNSCEGGPAVYSGANGISSSGNTNSPPSTPTTEQEEPKPEQGEVDLDDCTVAGNVINQDYGTIFLNGDSALDGNGDTQGNVEKALSQALNTRVVNCAIGGATANDMYSQTSCSNVNGCQWSVMTIGMNPNEGRFTARNFVDRELSNGKKVIILGHPDPATANLPPMPDYYQDFMNMYQTWANQNSRIYFLDTRTWTQYGDASYFADDQSHPSARMGTAMGNELASLISGTPVSSGPSTGNGGQPETPSTGSEEPEQPSNEPERPEESSSGSEDPEEEEEEEEFPEISFYESSTGSCPSGTYITSKAECLIAAETLDLPFRKAFSNPRRPRGCYVFKERVFYNRNPSLTTTSRRRRSICIGNERRALLKEDVAGLQKRLLRHAYY